MSISLFQPITVGNLDLSNRIFMAPLTRCRASAGRIPNDLMAAYYRQRSSAGLILSEASPTGASTRHHRAREQIPAPRVSCFVTSCHEKALRGLNP